MNFAKKLENRTLLNNLRTLTKPFSVDFASNDYLGFARCPKMRNDVVKAWEQIIPSHNGSTGSRLLTGNYRQIEELEAEIALFHRVEAALIFNSGYCANVGLLSCIANAEDVFLYDAHIHASSLDGIRLSRAKKRFSWRHNDLAHLEKRLRMLDKRGEVFVLVESIYSCDGSMAPLEALCELCEVYEAKLVVDEAHATGVMGNHGEGAIGGILKTSSILARMHTFSKALGVYGAVVLCSEELKQYLINYSRPFICATALPLPVILTIRRAYQELPNVDGKRQKLKTLVNYFKTSMCKYGFSLLPSETPIQSLIVTGNARVRHLSKELALHDYDVRALCAPTVKEGSERLRFCLHSFNTEKEVDALLQIFSRVMYF